MSRNHDQSLLRASTDARAQLAIDDYAYRVNQEIDHLALSLSLGDAANLGNAWRINATHNARPAGPPAMPTNALAQRLPAGNCTLHLTPRTTWHISLQCARHSGRPPAITHLTRVCEAGPARAHEHRTA